MNNVSMRLMTESDLGAADELRRLIGWNQTLEDWRRLLELEPQGCFIALRDQAMVGTVTTTAYGQALAWIGMVLVHPQHRRQGIAASLMRQALEHLQRRGVRSVKLDATPAGYPLYQRLGFVPEWTLTRCQRPAKSELAAPKSALAETRDLSAADWEAVDQVDAAAFGAPRSRLLRSLARHGRKALVWPANGAAAGWGLLRGGASADYLGPVVCPSAEGALALVAALLREVGPRPVIWDVPDPNDAAKAAAQRFGFRPLRPLTRMRLGPEAATSDARAQFAIADPAVG
jgi:predicted N-acetyltransferase YhbS